MSKVSMNESAFFQLPEEQFDWLEMLSKIAFSFPRQLKCSDFPSLPKLRSKIFMRKKECSQWDKV